MRRVWRHALVRRAESRAWHKWRKSQLFVATCVGTPINEVSTIPLRASIERLRSVSDSDIMAGWAAGLMRLPSLRQIRWMLRLVVSLVSSSGENMAWGIEFGVGAGGWLGQTRPRGS